ncbi:MAG: nucleoside triphosphate pyrophosphohydrolase [Lachnospiraceae bacterium]|nr:nucleoside triphosphate pyrophosphohydrolase [Lachnospiraceae bacterium]
MDFEFKERYNFDDLREIVKCLRQPDGCPWDKEQTHKSIRQDFIEETYEVIEAIDNEDNSLLREELGDVLLQVVFHACIEEEKGVFDIDDVANDICQKLIIRHPHVFGNVDADTTDKVLDNWDKIKMQTKSQKTQSQSIDSIARSLPSMMRASKIQKKAAKVGFDFADFDSALSKVYEELDEVKEAVANGTEDQRAEEIGDLLFSVVNVTRFARVDSEKALYDACEKFIKRFTAMEDTALKQGRELSQLSADELDALWNEAKK